MLTAELTARFKDRIRDVPDFPKPGIVFKDITPLLQEPDVFRAAVDHIAARHADSRVDAVVGIESRGFILGAPLAYALGCGFVPVRKPGKLPARTVRQTYTLEYGTDALEIHEDALAPGSRVLIVDDLLATGGTVSATLELVRQLGGDVIEAAFLVELSFLGGRARVAELGLDIYPILTY